MSTWQSPTRMLSAKQKMLIARAMYRLVRAVRILFGKHMRVLCTRKDILRDLDLDQGIPLSVYLLGACEPDTLRRYSTIIHTGDTVFDIGANIEAHTLHLSRLVGPAGRVVAFEPTDYAAGNLQQNLALNPALKTQVALKQVFLVAEPEESIPSSVISRWPVAKKHRDLDLNHYGKGEGLSTATSSIVDAICDREHEHRFPRAPLPAKSPLSIGRSPNLLCRH